MSTIPRSFQFCEKCGKKLIERFSNGIWYFRFGKNSGSDHPPVEIWMHGSIKIRCLRRNCGHVNVLNYFPNRSDNQPPAEVEYPKKTSTAKKA